MNLLSLIQNEISPNVASQIGNAVGESPDKTKSALGTAFPALLGSLIGKANASPNGAADVLNMVKQGPGQEGGWPDSIGKLLGGGGAAPAVSQSLLGSLFGSKLGAITDIISKGSGIRSGSATSLLGMAAPFLMGILGKQVAGSGLSAGGFGEMLNSQAQHVKDALPSGLADTLGISHFLPGDHGTQRITAPPKTAPTEPYVRPVEPAAPARPVQPGAEYSKPHAGGGLLRWLWVPLLLALIGWLVHRNQQNRNENMGGTGQPLTTQTATGRSANLSLTPGGAADNMTKAISAGEWNKVIPMQGVSFDSSGAVTSSSSRELQEIGSVLSAAPDVKVHITGYGETEEAGMNRANAIKAALANTGVSGDRVVTHGQAGNGIPTFKLSQ